MLAMELHAGQAYYGTEGDHRQDFVDYHLRPGVQVVRQAGGSELEVAVFWLHDSVEDTGITLDGLSDRGMPDEVIEGVDHMTWWRDRGQSYDEHLGRLAASGGYGWLKVVDSGRGNLDAALEMKRFMDPEEYDICVRKYAGNILTLGPRVLEGGAGRPWQSFVSSEVIRARSILDSHHGRTTEPRATTLPRPAFVS